MESKNSKKYIYIYIYLNYSALTHELQLCYVLIISVNVLKQLTKVMKCKHFTC